MNLPGRNKDIFSVCFVSVVIICYYIENSISTDRLTVSKSLTYNDTLTSEKKQFQLGFFSLGNPKKFYMGVWFNIIPTKYVWIANRENPLNDTSGVLRIGKDGNMVLQDRAERIVWSTNVTNLSSQNMVAQLMDSGNFILSSGNETRFIWQSFDHPSHVIIPGMKFGWELRTGMNLHLTSWKNTEDPSPGEYTYGFGLHGIPQIFIWKDGSKHYRSGPWNGKNFGGIIFNDARYPFGTNLTIDATEVYYEHNLLDNSSLFLAAIDYTGVLQLIFREKNSNNWSVLIVIPQDFCGVYAYCGPNGICEISDTLLCSCMPGYTPTNPGEWNVRIWFRGCVLESSAHCSERVHFKEYDSLKVPDLLQFKLNTTMNLDECKAECLKNCSCSAFANSNIDGRGGGSGCLLWFGDLIDVRTLGMTAYQKLYIRVSAEHSVLQSDSRKKRKIVVAAVIVAISISLLSLASILIWKRKSQKKYTLGLGQEREEENFELPYFDFVTITRATQDYSNMNKIGEGGFGPVYKGRLECGQEIAVKRLSETSNQGLDEFKNEVMLIAKLQHRNVVRLHGCCIHGEERMLVYEYMPNGSLDSYIFDGGFSNNSLLAWRSRFAVITGIARGLLYLHRDSRLRIIHRDLKASNVLLDSEMNPKISDFGMARTFGEDQFRMETKRVVGTYGYMAPEYVMDGVYSMKSDVFSFGVLVLEIVSGKRNNQFRHHDHDFNLLGHAWQLWLGERASELIDTLMEDSFAVSEVKRCIQIGLLCVQQRPEDRPTMAAVVSMLDSESAILPQPKRPGYYTERFLDESELPSDGRFWTVNDLTDTMIHGR